MGPAGKDPEEGPIPDFDAQTYFVPPRQFSLANSNGPGRATKTRALHRYGAENDLHPCVTQMHHRIPAAHLPAYT